MGDIVSVLEIAKGRKTVVKVALPTLSLNAIRKVAGNFCTGFI